MRRRRQRGRYEPGDPEEDSRPLFSDRTPLRVALALLLLIGSLVTWALLREPQPATLTEPPLSGAEKADVQQNLDNRAELHALLEKFLAATRPEEKAPLVRGGMAMLPVLRAYYAHHPDERGGRYRPGPGISVEVIGGRKFTLFGGRNALDEPVETIAEHTAEGLRLDWRYLTAAGDMEWDAWLRERPQREVVMRGFARRDEFYEGPFADKAKWFCMKVTDVTDAATVWAYVDRAAPEGRQLSEKLVSPDAVQRVTGRFVFPETPASFASGTPQVRASSLGALGWLDEDVPGEN